MSDQHTPAPAAAAAPAPLGATTPARETSKPAKSKGLSIFNRVALALLVIFLALTIGLFAGAAQRNKATEQMRDEIETVRDQTEQVAAASIAPAWCEKVTAANADGMKDIYQEYDHASRQVKDAIDKQCATRVDIARMVSSQQADAAFDTSNSTCAIAASGTSIHCSVDVKPASDGVKSQLAKFSSTTVTLEMWFDDGPLSITFNPKHKIDNVATVTLDSSGSGTVEFDADYDPSRGQKYGIGAVSFFPNE